jgi:hypothetical protein
MPAMAVGFYAEQDAVLTLKLWHHLKTFVRERTITNYMEYRNGAASNINKNERSWN